MVTAYLDRNVMSHLKRHIGGASPEHEASLRVAIREGRLAIPLSTVTLSETLLMDNNKQAFDEARWIIGLTGRGHVINDVVPLLNDCVRAYAHGASDPSPYVTTLDLSLITSATPRNVGRILMVMLEYKRQRAIWVEEWTARFERWKARISGKRTAQQFIDDNASEWLETFTDRAGVRAGCEQRGWDGLLGLKTLRLGVIPPLLLAHAKIFHDTNLEEAHFGDLHHLVEATTADLFVSHDRRLRELLSRTHVPGLEAITLPQLVRRLARPTDA
jgi:hypothetical protein